MNKLILFLIIGVLFVVGCSNNNPVNETCDDITCNAVLDTEHTINIDKLEIYHFHATHQCYSCITVGAYAEETVNTYFADELESGKIVFGHVNVDLLENIDLATKYEVTGSSLWLGIYDKNGFHKEENVNVWYKISNKQGYMNYLKGIIEQKLAGE